MSFVQLGGRTANAAADNTGLNPGNLTTAFTPSVLNVNVAYFEIYHMVVTGVPLGGSAQIFQNAKPWGFVYPNAGSEWNPPQPMLMRQTDEVDFLWSFASGSPIVTVWMRYDPTIQPSGIGH